MISRSIIKYIIIGLILLFLFHFEATYIGKIKISHLWKGVILVFLIISIFKGRNIQYFIYAPLLLLGILQILNKDIISSPTNAVIELANTAFLPILGLFVLSYGKENLERALFFFSVFIVLSFIPYQLGLLKSLSGGYNLESLGGFFGLIGPYQTPHGASIALSFALIVILFYLFTGSYNRIFLFILLTYGLYCLLLTYVRTGIAMFFSGALPLLIYFSYRSNKTFLLVIFIGFISTVLLSHFIMGNDVLLRRITGQHEVNPENSLETIGSGRVSIWMRNFDIFREANILEKIFGMGKVELLERMKEKFGIWVMSHNAFLGILLSYGIVGIIFFLKFLFNTLKFISKQSDLPYKFLGFSILVAYLIMSFVQTNNNVFAHIFLAISMGIIYRIAYFKNLEIEN